MWCSGTSPYWPWLNRRMQIRMYFYPHRQSEKDSYIQKDVLKMANTSVLFMIYRLVHRAWFINGAPYTVWFHINDPASVWWSDHCVSMFNMSLSELRYFRYEEVSRHIPWKFKGDLYTISSDQHPVRQAELKTKNQKGCEGISVTDPLFWPTSFTPEMAEVNKTVKSVPSTEKVTYTWSLWSSHFKDAGTMPF